MTQNITEILFQNVCDFFYFLGCELAPDVIYLGKIGLLTSSNGLKLAYASPNIDFEAVKNLEVRTSSFSDDFQGLFTISILTQFNLANFP